MDYALRIAMPIPASTMAEARIYTRKAEEIANRYSSYPIGFMIEYRLDFMKEPNLEELVGSSSLPEIMTMMSKHEGGKFEGSEDETVGCMQKAVDLGVKYVSGDKSSLSRISKKSTRLIFSRHDFNSTPENLQELYEQLYSPSADIVKITTMAKDYRDGYRMLDFISKIHDRGRDFIGLCMGKYGIFTRVLGPVSGSYLTFASIDKEHASAPSQKTVDELIEIWKQFGIVYST